MAKDPAFLFYTGDFAAGTMFMNDEQVGIYIRILIAQHQHGRLSKDQIMFFTKNMDQIILNKFKMDEFGLFYNERLEFETNKRKAFSESRRSNRNKLDNENCHIYFIKDKISGLIKIGSSVNPERRILELKNSENDLQLLFFTEKTSQKLETELHDIYKSHHSHLEWYNIGHMINDIILYLTENKIHMINHMENENENKDKKENKINKKIKEIGSEFEEFWNLYDKKKGRADSEKKWSRIPESEYIKILDHVPKYVLSTPDKQFRMDPETYLNGKHWNDEILIQTKKENGSDKKLSGYEKLKIAGAEALRIAEQDGAEPDTDRNESDRVFHIPAD